MTGPKINAAVLAAKEALAQGRAKLRTQHQSGSTGPQVCALFTELCEELVFDLFDAALAEIPSPMREELATKLALVAHSGFGRREMAPYSDVDLMLLHPFSTEEQILPLVRRFTQNLYDLGLDVGFSARTPKQACQLAAGDSTIFTSLTESRFLRGDQDLYNRFETRFAWLAKQNWRKLVGQVEAARKEERSKFGETVFLLEPNVKRSRGALREIQFIRWIGFARYGESDPESLMRAGHLAQADLRKIRQARDFLLWLRNDLHFHLDKASDLLDRSEQLRIAETRTYRPAAGLMPVEQFMQEYFQHTTEVREIAGYFVQSAQPRALLKRILEPVLSYQIEQDFRIGFTEISANWRGMAKLRNGDLAEMLRLLALANQYNRRLAHETWQTVRSAAIHRELPDPNEPLAKDVSERFMTLLSQGARLAELLRRLHELRVLEQIVPGMTHTRGLLQFNAYHRYTVDEHSLRAVQCITQNQSATGVPGEVYRGLKQKRTLHLATLIHDLGKGFVEDHSEVGARMAVQLGTRLGLPASEMETLRFLVLKHLRMAHLAQQHDIHDAKVIVQFAVEVGSMENLQMLYLLTLADLEAVGPGVLNEWKQELLTELYQHTHDLLSSDSPEDASNQRVVKQRNELLALVKQRGEPEWWQEQVAALSRSCLLSGPPKQLVEELARLRKLSPNEAVAWGRFLPERNVVEYTVGTHEEIAPGIFHRLTGMLTSQRHQILSAEINTLPGGLVLDRFYVRDQEFAGPPDSTRLREVSDQLVAALRDQSGKAPIFRPVWAAKARENTTEIQHLPTRVTVDNSTAERYTVLSVFAYDRMGLLYTIARTLFELELSISMAKIGTHLDQVVDVFYVTDRQGHKVADENRLAIICDRLLRALEELPS